MSISNGYVTRTDFLNWITPPSETVVAHTADDAVVDSIIESSSRLIDQITRRTFYPIIETRYFDVPNEHPSDLWLDYNDLLALTTLTNGDATAIASTDYILHDKNRTPYYKVSLRDVSTIDWELNSSNSADQVISILGTWGYHDDYSHAWEAVTTISEDLDISETGVDMTSVARMGVGSIIKIDSEIMIVSVVGTLTTTIMKRGDNGSTAAIHSSGATVYLWKPVQPIVQACQLICTSVYHKRYGENTESATTITAAGVVLTPRDIPEIAHQTLVRYMRLV
jgi:hypothetical protein